MPGFTTFPIRTLRTGERCFIRQEHAFVDRILRPVRQCLEALEVVKAATGVMALASRILGLGDLKQTLPSLHSINRDLCSGMGDIRLISFPSAINALSNSFLFTSIFIHNLHDVKITSPSDPERPEGPLIRFRPISSACCHVVIYT